MLNIHCIAHRLNLCTSQAGEDVVPMKQFRETLTILFKYFKASPVRAANLEVIQNLLDEPTLKFKEIYSVRWLAFYKALTTVQRSLDPLLTYFTDDNRKQDPSAVGLKKCSAGHFKTPTHTHTNKHSQALDFLHRQVEHTHSLWPAKRAYCT